MLVGNILLSPEDSNHTHEPDGGMHTDWDSVEKCFAACIELDEQKQKEYLESLREQDEALFQEVSSLLDHDRAVTSRKASEERRRTASESTIAWWNPEELVNKQLRDLFIKDILGEGGMGVVYLGEQKSTRRAVAVKVLRMGLGSTTALKRFDYETRILANLDHPNICKIHYAGKWRRPADGKRRTEVPYFVMEYLKKAHSLSEHVKKHQPTMRPRLELFLQVCDAIDHGHRNGIIHRDIKPANVLVDAAGNVKVIDFGVARCTNHDIAVTTMQTDTGQLVGTLQYMSPEQLEGHDRLIDTRSDIYALGLLLYELVCEAKPYDLSSTSLAQAVTTLRENPPRKPSLVKPHLKGDLEHVVLKALEKNPMARYQTVESFADDVRSYLVGDPVSAKAPGLWRRTLRYAGRHPAVFSGIVGLAICISWIAIGLGVTWYLRQTPAEIVIPKGSDTARLFSIGGSLLHEWESVVVEDTFNGLVSRAEELGGGSVIVLTLESRADSSQLAAVYDAENPGDAPLWTAKVRMDEMPPQLPQSKYRAEDFASQIQMCEDFFPERPGRELLVVFNHVPYSPAVIRIYDLNGQVLWQIWHDGPPRTYYLRSTGLLVFFATNGEAPWRCREFNRDLDDLHWQQPYVIFAARPSLGSIDRRLLPCRTNGKDVGLAWYRCLLPPETAAKFEPVRFRGTAPHRQKYESSRFFSVHFGFSDETRSSVEIIVDEHGNEVPETRVYGDGYRKHPELKDLEPIYLGDLPPIKQECIDSNDPGMTVWNDLD